ncbi:GNAT family N-acetyltransferase [Pseudomonas sp. M30-35]|uniref:GNAT family N-acetyltransferase n=1 Tax=Pseudomonas sp. M30-35 TaxID=1981174 RepID=UPI0021157C4C|nr:GNAT family N-acetyltransferase [Pseudomonas sp. M30-35]
MVTLRQAEAADIDALCALIFEHGSNPWNHLPPADVTAHLRAIATGDVQAVVASAGSELLGFVSYLLADHFAHYQPIERSSNPQAYICEAVTARQAAGQGLGSRLLLAAIDDLAEQGVKDIYIERHEENAASAGMMRKAGFVEIDCFDDRVRRPNGSGRTSVCCIRL